MRRGLGGTVLETEESRDKELTFGPMGLSALGLAFLAVCAVCFISGYALGHHPSDQAASVSTVKEGPSAAQLFNAQPKPSATPAAVQPKTDGAAEVNPDSTEPADTESSATPIAETAPQQHATVVPATLPAQASGGPAVPSGQNAVRAALPQGGPGSTVWMVQVAVTANAKDAGLMVSDLRGKGVNVSMRRDAANLVYVQAGPFSTHEEAAAMRQKVVAAGYNAVIQP